jgi:hypothetical protein
VAKRKKPMCFDLITINFLTGLGIKSDIVERRVAARLTKDLFGFGDIFGFDMSGNCYIVQHTSRKNLSTRIKKIVANDIARDWLEASDKNLIWALGWYQSNGDWTAKVVSVSLGDFPDASSFKPVQDIEGDSSGSPCRDLGKDAGVCRNGLCRRKSGNCSKDC